MTPEQQHTPRSRNYVIIMPCRNEEQFIQDTLDCLVRQTIRPAECIVVDDGSSDRTGNIGDAAAKAYPWMHVVRREDRGERRLGAGVIEAFYEGFRVLRTQNYEYICKLDADVSVADDYFEKIVIKMEEDPRLGGASGKVFNPSGDKLFEERIIDEMVAGQVSFWRRRCWEEIGGFVKEVMWDGINFHRAQMLGWKTRSFHDDKLRILHHRLMGSSHRGILRGRMRWGRGQWFMGTHPLYIIASGVYRMQERPYIVGGLLIIAGYFAAMVRRQPRYHDRAFRNYLHRWQLRRLGLKWLAPKEG